MILLEVEAIESIRRSTRTAVSPPAITEKIRMPATPKRNPWRMMAVKPRRSTTSRPTTSSRPLSSATERTTALPWRSASPSSANGRCRS